MTLDDDKREAAPSHARATGQRLGRVLSDTARQALQPDPHRNSAARSGSRFAAFDVPPDAGLIPASRIQQALWSPRERLPGFGAQPHPELEATCLLSVGRS